MPIEKVSIVKPVSIEEKPAEKPVDDTRYFKLSKPVSAGDTVFDKLLVDSTELSGSTYFKLVGRFRKEYPEIYRSSFNKLAEEVFLSYVIAELNPPLTTEDVAKISFIDLPILFISAQSFIFGGRNQDQATKE